MNRDDVDIKQAIPAAQKHGLRGIEMEKPIVRRIGVAKGFDRFVTIQLDAGPIRHALSMMKDNEPDGVYVIILTPTMADAMAREIRTAAKTARRNARRRT